MSKFPALQNADFKAIKESVRDKTFYKKNTSQPESTQKYCLIADKKSTKLITSIGQKKLFLDLRRGKETSLLFRITKVW